MASCTTRQACVAATGSTHPGDVVGPPVVGGHPHIRLGPARVVQAVIEFLCGPLAQDPHRVGMPLRDGLVGLHSARRGSYHVLFEIDDDTRVVTDIRIAHRSSACRPH